MTGAPLDAGTISTSVSGIDRIGCTVYTQLVCGDNSVRWLQAGGNLHAQDNEWFEVMEEIAVGAPNEHIALEAPGLINQQ